MGLVDVAALAELQDGVPKVVKAGGREIVLVRWRERVFALRNVCPHQTQSFAGGVIAPKVKSGGRPGALLVDDETPVLVCPWHHWEYELETGRCPIDTRVRVRAYRTVVESERVLVDLAT